ncbi:unnamed protein product, partial [Rotaria sp. Silwood2]
MTTMDLKFENSSFSDNTSDDQTISTEDILIETDSILSINILPSNSKEKEMNQQEASFMYFLLLTDILIGMEHKYESKMDMINECRSYYIDNERILKQIDEFDKTYKSSDAIWWYSRHCFIYERLNRALRLQDIDILFKYRFYLTDLYKKINQLYLQYIQSLPIN